MPSYLIDVNLPYYFSYWRSDEYIHQIDLQNDADDYEIWQYAKERGLTIVTKDADFSDRMLLSEPPPRVIHISNHAKLTFTLPTVFLSIIFLKSIR